MRKANYEKRIKNSGEIIEIIGHYDDNESIIMSPPPDMLSEEEESIILDILKKNNIKMISFII